MNRLGKLIGFYGVVLISLFSSSSRADLSIEAFETQLDFTIRSACHGYMVDAIPEFLSGSRSWLNENTPFCQSVRTLAKDQSAYALLKKQSPSSDYRTDPEYKIKYLSGYNEDLYRHNDCNDWLCEHIRDQVYDKGNPISLEDYRKIALHCDDHYGCIESWFKTWPRSLPKPTKRVQLSLDTLLNAQSTKAPVTALTTNQQNPSSGLSLDSLMGTETSSTTKASLPEPTKNQSAIANNHSSTEHLSLTLDDVFSGREQLALEKSLHKISQYNQELTRQCQCSLNNSGCFKLPSKSLLKEANNLEQKRFAICSDWQQKKGGTPTHSDQAKQRLLTLAKTTLQVSSLDQEMDNTITNWETKQRRIIAQRKKAQQDKESSAYLAGMASILAQAGAVANGNISANQAAQNAVNVSKNVEQGNNWGTAMTRNISSSVPNYTSNSASTSNGSSSANGTGNFACFDPRQQICIDYSISNIQKANQFKQQCQRGNNRVISSCDQKGPSCSMSSSVGRQTTYSYMSQPNHIKEACINSGGQYSPN